MAFESLHDMFYFKVELDYVYNVTLVQNRTFEQVSADIQAEIDARMRPFRSVVSVSGLVSMILLFQVFLKFVCTYTIVQLSVHMHF